MQRRISALLLMSFFAVSAMGLSGCGVKGELQTPPPLWGDQDKQEKPEGETKD